MFANRFGEFCDNPAWQPLLPRNLSPAAYELAQLAHDILEKLSSEITENRRNSPLAWIKRLEKSANRKQSRLSKKKERP